LIAAERLNTDEAIKKISKEKNWVDIFTREMSLDRRFPKYMDSTTLKTHLELYKNAGHDMTTMNENFGCSQYVRVSNAEDLIKFADIVYYSPDNTRALKDFIMGDMGKGGLGLISPSSYLGIVQVPELIEFEKKNDIRITRHLSKGLVYLAMAQFIKRFQKWDIEVEEFFSNLKSIATNQPDSAREGHLVQDRVHPERKHIDNKYDKSSEIKLNEQAIGFKEDSAKGIDENKLSNPSLYSKPKETSSKVELETSNSPSDRNTERGQPKQSVAQTEERNAAAGKQETKPKQTAPAEQKAAADSPKPAVKPSTSEDLFKAEDPDADLSKIG
jgi:hypothetical protein